MTTYEMYTVIIVNEDGDVSVEQYEREILLERLNDGYWGDGLHFVDSLTLSQQGSDPMEWSPGGTHMVILPGVPVVPSQVPVRTEYAL
jgi:hypothetical protein